jgi:hypothetical protein
MVDLKSAFLMSAIVLAVRCSYDHLDKRTIAKLIKQPYGPEMRFYIGLGE